MRTCEPLLALFTVSGCPTDALVSDCSSKDGRSSGQDTRWLVPAVEWPAQRIFAVSMTQSCGNSEPSAADTDLSISTNATGPNLTIPIEEPMLEKLVDEGRV
jgi:hypothetical protein